MQYNAYNVNNNLDEVLLAIVCTVYSGNIIIRINAIPNNCIVTKLDRQQMQGNDVMCLLYFDINLYHLRTKTGIQVADF